MDRKAFHVIAVAGTAKSLQPTQHAQHCTCRCFGLLSSGVAFDDAGASSLSLSLQAVLGSLQCNREMYECCPGRKRRHEQTYNITCACLFWLVHRYLTPRHLVSALLLMHRSCGMQLQQVIQHWLKVPWALSACVSVVCVWRLRMAW